MSGRCRVSVASGETVKVIFDSKTDTAAVVLKDAEIAESDEEKPGVILDYDEHGDIVSLGILDASWHAADQGRRTLRR